VKAATAVSVPAGSTLVIRATGKSELKIATTGGIAEVAGDQRPQAPTGTEERRYTINEGGTASVRGIGDDLTWTFSAIPDRVPTIALTKEPEASSASRSPTRPRSRGRSTARRKSNWCCRRRAPRAASARPSRIFPSIPGPAPMC
jgi:hypothetical protein